MYQEKMAMISAFKKLMLLFFMAYVTSALNSPVPVVQTVSNVTLISGKKALLSCKYNRTIYAVYWRYESTASPMELLVVMDEYYEEGKRSGPGYDEGRFDITNNYSLIIRDVKATDEGKYICEVSDFETGSTFRNHTDVTTVVVAERPFVHIEQCEDEDQPCVLHTTSEDHTVQLTCTVVGAKPMVDLTWEASMSSEHWKHMMNQSTLTTRDRGNGVFDQTLTVIVDTSYIKSNKQLFTCFGRGLAVDGVANRTIAVYHQKVSDVTWTVVAVVISVICTLLFTFVIIGIWWKVRDKRPSQKAMVKKIKHMKADERVYLGVLGEEGAGKKSFIDSLVFFIQESDTRSQDRIYVYESNKIWEYTQFIFEGLRIRKQRDDLPMIEPEEIPTILMSKEKDNSSSRAAINMETEDLIHFPIFVFDISNKNDGDNRMELLRKLAESVHNHILQYPMIVLTKAAAVEDLDEKKLIRKLIKKTKIPRENILVTFEFSHSNNRIDNHTRAEQLDFILKCVDKVHAQKKEFKKSLSEEEKSKMPFLDDSTV